MRQTQTHSKRSQRPSAYYSSRCELDRIVLKSKDVIRTQKISLSGASTQKLQKISKKLRGLGLEAKEHYPHRACKQDGLNVWQAGKSKGYEGYREGKN